MAGIWAQPLDQPARVHRELPVFRLDAGDHSIFYVPGHVAVVASRDADALQRLLDDDAADSSDKVRAVARRLRTAALESAAAWRRLAEEPFAPECLTIYLSNHCNLACSYCYAAPSRDRRSHDSSPELDRTITIDNVRAGADLVARICARKGKRFVIVLHGGGEPTLHWALLEEVVSVTRQVAARHGLEWWAYVATHGAISTEKAEWLSEHFSLIGLSCDGPVDIHDAQRPTRGGVGTSAIVERTARILAARGTPFVVRATVTRANMSRQTEIVRYLHDRLAASEIKLEPAYSANGSLGPAFWPEDAAEFVGHFLAAEQVARELGCTVSVSGIRMDEIHGPYCNVLRDVLHLTPDGRATACFLTTEVSGPANDTLAIGSLSAAQGFALDVERIARIRSLATRVPERCEQCVNVYHCARECPDVCVLPGHEPPPGEGGFRCRVQKRLGQQWIVQAAEALIDADRTGHNLR